MELLEYQCLALRTALPDRDTVLTAQDMKLVNASLGLSGEAGEFTDLVKKVICHGHPYTMDIRERLIKELGDVLWYCARAADALETTLDLVAVLNIDKLRQRYPEGFSQERSLHRGD